MEEQSFDYIIVGAGSAGCVLLLHGEVEGAALHRKRLGGFGFAGQLRIQHARDLRAGRTFI